VTEPAPARNLLPGPASTQLAGGPLPP